MDISDKLCEELKAVRRVEGCVKNRQLSTEPNRIVEVEMVEASEQK